MLIKLEKRRYVAVDTTNKYQSFPETKQDGTEFVYVNTDDIVVIRPSYNLMSGVSLDDGQCYVIVSRGRYEQTLQILGTADEVARKVEACGRPEQVTARELMDELDT